MGLRKKAVSRRPKALAVVSSSGFGFSVIVVIVVVVVVAAVVAAFVAFLPLSSPFISLPLTKV